MRIGLIVIGLIIAGCGIAAMTGKFHFTQTSEVAKVGPVSINSRHDETPPSWAGIAGLVVGLGLVGVGLIRKA